MDKAYSQAVAVVGVGALAFVSAIFIDTSVGLMGVAASVVASFIIGD